MKSSRPVLQAALHPGERTDLEGVDAAADRHVLDRGALCAGRPADRPLVPARRAKANGEIQMLAPHQKIHFNIRDTTVEYWNYDYPGGLMGRKRRG